MKEMMDSYFNQDNVVIIGTIIAALVLFSIWSRKVGHDSVVEWAEKKRIRIISSHRSFFLPNFRWSSGKYQQFYRVTVSDQEGKTREGWVRCSKLWVTEPEKVEVAWDDERKTSKKAKGTQQRCRH